MRNNPAIFIALVVLLSLGANRVGATTVCEVQAYDRSTGLSLLNGQTITVTGIVTVPVGVFQPTATSVYIRGLADDDCGVNVYSRVRVEDIGIGDTLTVTGQVQDYISTSLKGATTEVTFAAATDVIVKRGSTIPQPEVMSTGQVGQEANEGKYVRVTAKLVTGVLGRSFSVDDGTGTLEVFDLSQNFAADSTWKGLSYGEEVTVTGIVSQSIAGPPYFGGYSLVPRSPAFGDVEVTRCIPGGSKSAYLELSGKIFSPRDGENLTITYNSPHGSRLRLRIFDVCGRCVANLDDRLSVCGKSGILWDGRNEVREELPSGLYQVVVTAIDTENGKETQEAVPVVIGRRLR